MTIADGISEQPSNAMEKPVVAPGLPRTDPGFRFPVFSLIGFLRGRTMTRRVPRHEGMIDIEKMFTQSDFDDDNLTEMEYLIIYGGPRDVQRFREKVMADPELALLSWREQVTLLHVCASYNIYDLAEFLIRNNADINAICNQGTPLHVATEFDHIAIIELLLTNGADVNLIDRMLRPPLHEAALRDDAVALRILLSHGALVNVRDRFGLTPLDLAAYNNRRDVVVELLKHGATSRRKRTRSYIAALKY